MILEGRSTVDQSLLTGESKPVRGCRGDRVHAGTVNLAARIASACRCRGRPDARRQADAVGGRVQSPAAPIVQFADRVAGWFVIVVSLAGHADLRHLVVARPSRAVDHAVALLIVTCPCALGLATPLAMTVALGRAAKRQILIKGGEVLELLARSRRYWCSTKLVRSPPGVLPLSHGSVTRRSSRWSRPWSGIRRIRSPRPSSRLLRPRYDPDARNSLEVVDCQQQHGAGLAGTVAGRTVVVGSMSYLRSQQVTVSEPFEQAEQDAINAGASPVLVGVDGQCVAVGSLDDPLRDDAVESVGRLQKDGWRIAIVSGDHPRVVARVGERLELQPDRVIGGASPEEKVAYVERARVAERVVMVGDGVNDAAALSAASVGIAVHGGAEASLAAADVYLNRPGLSAIAELVAAARSTLRTIHRSLAISLVYNGIAASLAMAGLIGPLFAAILMPISSFSVLALAFFSPTFGEAR